MWINQEKIEVRGAAGCEICLSLTLTCEVLVHSSLVFGMDHIKKLKLKDPRVLLCYNFGSEKLKGVPKKM